jgi:hypothetical protein
MTKPSGSERDREASTREHVVHARKESVANREVWLRAR